MHYSRICWSGLYLSSNLRIKVVIRTPIIVTFWYQNRDLSIETSRHLVYCSYSVSGEVLPGFETSPEKDHQKPKLCSQPTTSCSGINTFTLNLAHGPPTLRYIPNSVWTWCTPLLVQKPKYLMYWEVCSLGITYGIQCIWNKSHVIKFQKAFHKMYVVILLREILSRIQCMGTSARAHFKAKRSRQPWLWNLELYGSI